MTVAEKNYIIRYRQVGKSCTEIARALGLSVNTVKSFCQRNEIAPIGKQQEPVLEKRSVCAVAKK